MSREPGKADPAAMAVTLLELVQQLANELHPRRPRTQRATLDSSLDRDLGLDSLARLELLVRLEKSFGVTLPERVFADAATPRDLLRAVLGAGAAPSPRATMEVVRLELGEAQAAPHSAQTLVEALNWHVDSHPDRTHIRFYDDEGEGQGLTYGQLRKGAESVAVGLQHRGLQKGEPVAIMLPTGQDYFFSFLGILLAGGVPVPIYPPVRMANLADHVRRHRAILGNCGAATLITVPEAKRFARLLKSQVESLRHLVTAEELSSRPGSYLEPKCGAQDTAFLQYTSGSTGDPKGVILTHANLLANIRAMGEAVLVKPDDVFVSWLPLYHDMGLIGAWLANLYYASLLVIMSPLAFIARPQRWLRAIHRYRGTLAASPNFGYELCLKKVEEADIEGLDLSSWRVACNGAEAIAPDTVHRFCRKFAPHGFRPQALMPVYGLAECSVGLTFPPLGRGPLIDRVQREPFLRDGLALPAGDGEAMALQFVSCGHPLPGHEVRVVDSDGRELPERQSGHLQFRGPSATSGYFRNPEQTRRLFQADWLNTGDLAYIANGEVHITGRSKDIIIRAGRNIHPQELEDAVGEIPRVRKGSVAVLASGDPASGTERLVVIAETHEGEDKDADELRARIMELAVDLVGTPPDDVVLVPPRTILKTSSGKIRRAANRELYERGMIGKQPRAIMWEAVRIGLAGLRPELRRAWRHTRAGAYAAYCWTLLGLLAPWLWAAITLLPSVRWRWAAARMTSRFLIWVSRTKLIVQGLENLPPEGTYVLAANHASYIDSLVLAGVLPGVVSFVAKSELAQVFGLRFFLRRLQTEFVERFDKQKSVEDARRLAAGARSGQPLVFFAEGTFTRVPGLLPFHMGAFVVAAENDLPLIPLAIRGTRSILRDGSWFPRQGAIAITIGKAISSVEAGFQNGDDHWTKATKLRDAAREHILRHCGEPDLARERAPR